MAAPAFRDLGRLAPEVASFDGAGALEAEIGEGGNRRIAAIRRFLIPMTGVPIHLAQHPTNPDDGWR